MPGKAWNCFSILGMSVSLSAMAVRWSSICALSRPSRPSDWAGGAAARSSGAYVCSPRCPGGGTAVGHVIPCRRCHHEPATFDIVILGLSITSSWGNGHATTYRGLVQALAARGHDVLFLERDVLWYAARDLPIPPYGRTALYTSLDDLQDRFSNAIRWADVVMVGSYVPDGVAIGTWVTQTARGVTAFYDIDTPVTREAAQRRA